MSWPEIIAFATVKTIQLLFGNKICFSGYRKETRPVFSAFSFLGHLIAVALLLQAVSSVSWQISAQLENKSLRYKLHCETNFVDNSCQFFQGCSLSNSFKYLQLDSKVCELDRAEAGGFPSEGHRPTLCKKKVQPWTNNTKTAIIRRPQTQHDSLFDDKWTTDRESCRQNPTALPTLLFWGQQLHFFVQKRPFQWEQLLRVCCWKPTEKNCGWSRCNLWTEVK